MQSARTLPLRTRTKIPNRVIKSTPNKYHTMSALFYPSRQLHRRQPYGYGSSRGVVPYYSHGSPVSLSTSPWASTDPLNFAFDQPFHQPFLSLFNDTFSQLDRLSNELNGHLNTAFSNQNGQDGTGKSMLTWAPKFDIKETDDAYVLEGEMPGIERKNVNIEWADNNTMVVKGRTETYREEGEKPATKTAPGEASGALPAADTSANGAKDSDTSPTNAPDTATTNGATESHKDTAMTTTNANKDVAKQTAQPTYHLTERTVGTFQRVFSFPGEVQHDNVKASLKNGVLTVTVPKVVKDAAEEKKARTVEVEEVKDEADTVKEADKMQA